jgi:hypothetical protein
MPAGRKEADSENAHHGPFGIKTSDPNGLGSCDCFRLAALNG